MKNTYPRFCFILFFISSLLFIQGCHGDKINFVGKKHPKTGLEYNANNTNQNEDLNPRVSSQVPPRCDDHFTRIGNYIIDKNRSTMFFDPSAVNTGEHVNSPIEQDQFSAHDLNPVFRNPAVFFENKFIPADSQRLSTFGIDVDGASYSNVRGYINSGQLPPGMEVRTEEMINYFPYHYPYPKSEDPLFMISEISECPWNAEHRLISIGIKGKELDLGSAPASNFVFLIDVSGSMNEPNKLPLVVSSLKLLTPNLRANDKVAIVVYAGAAGLVLPSTSGDHKTKIIDALDKLSAGGSTAGAAGIELAYKIAKENFIPGGNNRVILATDGDFNVGVASDAELESLIAKKKEDGIFLSVLGYGTGNYQDAKMQTLADKGNGNHFYIDSEMEAKKVLVNEMGGTLFTIAKDVKLQIEFNSAKVKEYRLIGYENRMLNTEDFADDKKDAGELGAGHCVTALYEIIPMDGNAANTNNLTSSNAKPDANASTFDDVTLLTINLRYKQPDGDESKLLTNSVRDTRTSIEYSSEAFRFAASVAEFALLLRNSEYKGQANFEQVLSLASGAVGVDTEGYRKEFVELVKKAQLLKESADIANK